MESQPIKKLTIQNDPTVLEKTRQDLQSEGYQITLMKSLGDRLQIEAKNMNPKLKSGLELEG